MPQICSVSEITLKIKALLDASFESAWVSGEISNFKHHPSGHMYFTLKDEGAELRAVMFRGYNQFLRFSPADGMKVVVNGSITVYAYRGYYQIVVHHMETAGVGALFLAFEALKKKLDAEGLFDEKRKKPIPRLPDRVGVVTSSSGAAIQDILRILSRRSPYVEVVFRPTRVQGEGAAEDIVSAIGQFTLKNVDVLIIGRGGGSIEDLWAFNEEKVARAIANCPIPVISAVGHETDYTIADFVADLRAPTPSAGAEMVAYDKEELLFSLSEWIQRINRSLDTRVGLYWQRLDAMTSRYGFQHPHNLIEQKFHRLNELIGRLDTHLRFSFRLLQSTLVGLNQRLLSASPKSILGRGYSVAFSLRDRRILNRVSQLSGGSDFGLLVSDGEILAESKGVIKGTSRKD